MRLKGKVVLITASTRGIGLACAVRCAKMKERLSIWQREIWSVQRRVHKS